MTKKAVYLPGPDNDDMEDVFETDTRQPNQKTRSESLLEELVEDLNDVSDNVSLRIYQQMGNGQESMAFVEAMPHDKFTNKDDLLMYLRESYGPGSYRLQVRVAGKLRANKLEQIIAKKNAPVTPAQNDNGALGAIMARMEKQDQMIAQLLQQKGNSNSGNKKEFLEEMLIYKQLFGGNQSSGGLGQIQEALSFVKELGINVGGPVAEREEGFVDIMDKAFPLIQAALSQPQPQRQQPAPADMQNHMMKMQLKMAIDQAVSAAERGKDAADFAETVIDTIGEEKAGQLISDPNFLKIIPQYNQRANLHLPWFGDVAEHIKGMLGLPSKYAADYNDLPIDQAETNGDADNVPINGDT